MGMTRSNIVYKEVVFVSNFDRETPLSGLSSSDFTFSFTKDGTTYSDSVTTAVEDIGSGWYNLSMTFPSEGFWSAVVAVSLAATPLETHQLNVNVRDSSGDAIYSSLLTGSVAMTQDVGGLPSGTTVSALSNGTKTVSQVLDSLLFPTAYPTYSQPSCSLSDNVSNLQTVGASISITLTTAANRGTINTGWDPGSQGSFAGNVTAAYYSYNSVNTSINVGPGTTAVDDVSLSNHAVTLGTNSWTLVVTFADGVDPVDSTGAIVTSAAYSTGTKSNSTSFEGVYPIILGTSAGGFSNRTLVSHSSNNIEVSQNYNETIPIRHRIKLPDSLINSRTVVFQQWNSVASAYADLSSAEFTSNSVTETVEGLSVGYTMYTKSGSIGGGDVSGQSIYRVRFS
jgi:hypothetical protein